MIQERDIFHLLETTDLIELCEKLYGELDKKESDHTNRLKTIENLEKKLANVHNSNNQLITKIRNLEKQPKIEDRKAVIKLEKTIDKLQRRINSQQEILKKVNYSSQCSGKVRYDTSIDADYALSLVQRSSNKKIVPKRKYKCTICGGFHLTSKNKNDRSNSRSTRDRKTSPKKDGKR